MITMTKKLNKHSENDFSVNFHLFYNDEFIIIHYE